MPSLHIAGGKRRFDATMQETNVGIKMATSRAGLEALQPKDVYERGDKQHLLY